MDTNDRSQTEQSEKRIRTFFFVSLVLKGLNAFIEILGGALLLMSGTVTGIIAFFTRKELLEDPTDIIANFIQHATPYLSAHTQLFIAIYLLVHGIVKAILVVELLRNRIRAYPLAIGVFSAFAAYEIYRYWYSHSLFLLTLIIFDVMLIALAWHEYRYMKKRPASDILTG